MQSSTEFDAFPGLGDPISDPPGGDDLDVSKLFMNDEIQPPTPPGLIMGPGGMTAIPSNANTNQVLMPNPNDQLFFQHPSTLMHIPFAGLQPASLPHGTPSYGLVPPFHGREGSTHQQEQRESSSPNGLNERLDQGNKPTSNRFVRDCILPSQFDHQNVPPFLLPSLSLFFLPYFIPTGNEN